MGSSRTLRLCLERVGSEPTPRPVPPPTLEGLVEVEEHSPEQVQQSAKTDILPRVTLFFTSGFGQNKPTAFGQPQVSAAPAFGNTTGFGTNTSQPATGGLFGTSQPSAFGSSFGQNTLTTNQPQQNNQIGLFGNTGNTQKPAFGAATTQPFGQTATSGTGLFGATQKPAFGFGQPTSAAPPAFGTSTGFGATTSQPGGQFGFHN